MTTDSSEGNTETSQQFVIEKSGVEAAQLTTAVWADLLAMTSRRMDRLDGDAYEIEVEVTIRDDS